MKIISPSFEILTPLDGQAILKHIELCGSCGGVPSCLRSKTPRCPT